MKKQTSHIDLLIQRCHRQQSEDSHANLEACKVITHAVHNAPTLHLCPHSIILKDLQALAC